MTVSNQSLAPPSQWAVALLVVLTWIPAGAQTAPDKPTDPPAGASGETPPDPAAEADPDAVPPDEKAKQDDDDASDATGEAVQDPDTQSDADAALEANVADPDTESDVDTAGADPPSDADAALEANVADPDTESDVDTVGADPPSDTDAALSADDAKDPDAVEDSDTETKADVQNAGDTDAGAADNVLKQLDESAAAARDGLFDRGPLSVLHPAWKELNTKLDDDLGLRLGVSYYVLFQYASSGPGERSAVAGVFDFFGRWTLFKNDKGDRGMLGFNIEDRHAFTDIPPSDLYNSIGSNWPTTRGFSDSGFRMNELWWDQRFANDRVRLRVGMINQKHFIDLYRFKSQKRFFLSADLSDSPTIAFPGNGFGATLRVSPLKDLHIRATIGDANGTRRIGDIDNFFADREFFSSVDIAFAPTFEHLGRARYSFTGWHTDAASDRDRPSGYGFNFSAEQEISKGVVPFARYGYGTGADLNVEHIVSLGLGIEKPFGRANDVFGIGGSWGHPSDGSLRDQWTMEVFYRFQLTPVIHVTPGFQLIVNPSQAPDAEVDAVFEFRIGVVF